MSFRLGRGGDPDRLHALLEYAEATQGSGQSMLLAVLRASPLPTMASNRKGAVVLWNPAAERVFGWRAHEVLGRKNPIIPSSRLDEFEALRQAVLSGTHLVGVNTCRCHRDGTDRNVKLFAAPLRGRDSEILGTMAVLEDITEDIRLAEELRRSHALLQAVAEGTDDAVFVKDLDGRYLLINSAGARALGLSKQDIIGRTDFELMDTETARVFANGDRAVLESGTVRSFEEAQELGRRIYLATKGPYRDQDGHVVGVIGIARDITERKQMEGELRQAHKMEALGRLAAGVAHDFNNLTTAVLLYSDLLLGQLGPQSRLRRYAEEIRRAGDRGTTLVNQLLAYAGQQVFHPQPVDLNELLADMDDLLHRLLGEDVELSMELTAGLGPVLADRSQMEQMILNLAANARDAMPSGGRLTLKTSNAEAPETAYSPLPALRCVCLEVRDTGTGMDATARRHAFDPFFTTKAPGKGTGLGLAMVERMVNGAGGSIQLESRPGQGTTVRILLPRAEALQEELAEPVFPVTNTRDRETVLLVEDEDAVRHSLAESLELYGYRVLAARHGRDALDVLRRHIGPIHLVVTDLVMPGMSGRELAEEIVRLRPRLPVLLISGYSDEARTAQLPGRAFFPKPFSAASFVRRVREVLDTAQNSGPELASGEVY